MPISDLLASITGDPPTKSPTTISRPDTPAIKRKADGDLRDGRAKTPRTESFAKDGPQKPQQPVDRSSRVLSDKPTTARPSLRPTNTVSQRPLTASKPGLGKSSTVSTQKSALSRPAPTRTVGNGDGPKPQPKKSSFAEIMARASANSAARESFGKIQHKPIERTLTMRERKEKAAEEARNAKKPAKKQLSGKYVGTAAPSRGSVRPGGVAGSVAAAKKPTAKETAAPAVAETKFKKAKMATTGYQGTARPRPGASTQKPGGAAVSRADKPRERPRYGGASRSRGYDEYDEEFDDFIEYDDEEEQPAYGYGRREYDSLDDESDMEAGMDLIDEEETRAERAARLEDLKEQALEKKLKQEKEERKRRYMSGPSR